MEHKHNTESHQSFSLECSNVELGDIGEQPLSVNTSSIQGGNKKGQGDQYTFIQYI